jgi:hypothetical protein
LASYHCCATCVHFLIEKSNGKITYKCSRLGYETHTTYVFDCWTPKENVKKLIQKRALTKMDENESQG